MEAQQLHPPDGSCLRLRGSWDAGLNRWLWLTKWLLAIPRYIVLAGIEQVTVGPSLSFFIEVPR